MSSTEDCSHYPSYEVSRASGALGPKLWGPFVLPVLYLVVASRVVLNSKVLHAATSKAGG